MENLTFQPFKKPLLSLITRDQKAAKCSVMIIEIMLKKQNLKRKTQQLHKLSYFSKKKKKKKTDGNFNLGWKNEDLDIFPTSFSYRRNILALSSKSLSCLNRLNNV